VENSFHLSGSTCVPGRNLRHNGGNQTSFGAQSRDCQAAIKALSSVRQMYRLTINCKDTLNAVSSQNNVTLIWIPRHKGHEGYDKADELARSGSELSTKPKEVQPLLNSIKR